MTENKWRENLKETTRLITSQAFSLDPSEFKGNLERGNVVDNDA